MSPPIPTAVRISRLACGLRVATLREPTAPFSSLGLYVKAGARHEPARLVGASHVLASTAFKNSPALPDATDTVSELGGNVVAVSTRENIAFQASMLREKLPLAMSLFARTMTRRSFSDAEVASASANMLFGLEEARKMPAAYVREYLYERAFAAGQGYGMSQNIYSCQDRIARLTPSAISEYARARMQPENIVLVCAGPDEHERVVDLAEHAFAHVSTEPDDAATEDCGSEPLKYSGGSSVHVIEAPPPTHPNATRTLTYMQLAFAGPCSLETRESLGAHVLQFLLGGGDAFSSGGPGKGMYSRLFTDVLNRNRHVESATAFYETYADCGLFGIQGSCDPRLNSRMLGILASEIMRAAFDPVSDEELARAKNQLRSFMLMALESQLVRVENAGLQLLMRDSYLPPSEISTIIENIDVGFVQTQARRLLANRPTCVVHGQAGHLDNLPDIERELGALLSVPSSLHSSSKTTNARTK